MTDTKIDPQHSKSNSSRRSLAKIVDPKGDIRTDVLSAVKALTELYINHHAANDEVSQPHKKENNEEQLGHIAARHSC